MFHLTSLQNSTHWESSPKSLTANLTADAKHYISSVTGEADYLIISLTSHTKEKSRVVILSRSHPNNGLEESTLLLNTSSPIIFTSTHNSTGLLVQEDGSLVLFRVEEGSPRLVSCNNILSHADNIVTNVCISYVPDCLIWTEGSHKEGRYNSVFCSLSLLDIQQGEMRGKKVYINYPQAEIFVNDGIVLIIPKDKFFSGIFFLYSLKRIQYKIVDWSRIADSNLQPWKNDLSIKHFMLHQTSLGARNDNDSPLLAVTPADTCFYVLDVSCVLWKLSVDERYLLSREKICLIGMDPCVSGETILITSFQQLIFVLKGNNLRVYEPTQGVCVQSDIQSDVDIDIHTYLHHKYQKMAITTQSDILLLENLPLKDQVSHLHASVPDENRLTTLVGTPDLIKPWSSNYLQIKSILEAVYWICKRKPSDCIESTHIEEIELLFTQINHDRIENPAILIGLFSKFPKFQMALQRELSIYDNSLNDMRHIRSNMVPFYYKGEFGKNISALSPLLDEKDNALVDKATDVTEDSVNKVRIQVIDYINSVVTESTTRGICTGYTYIFEYLCLVSPGEVLHSIKYYFSQDHRHNPNDKINWKKLFTCIETPPTVIREGRETLPSIFETVCRLVFQYDPDYLVPFINKCQHLLDVDGSKEPAFMRKSSRTRTYQRALDSLPDLSCLLSGGQELTVPKAIAYYKVLNNSKTLNSGNKCIQILASVCEWKTALSVLQQYTQNDYFHFYLFTNLSYLMNKAGVLCDYSEELYSMRTNNYSVGEHLQMFNQLYNYHSDNSCEGGNNVAPFLKILLRSDTTQQQQQQQQQHIETVQ